MLSSHVTLPRQESTSQVSGPGCECTLPGHVALGGHTYIKLGEESPRECSVGFFVSIGKLLPDHVRKASGTALHMEKRSEDGSLLISSRDGSFFIQAPEDDVNALIKLWFISHCLKNKSAQGTLLEISDLEIVKWENRDFSHRDDEMEQEAMEQRLQEASLVVLRFGSLVVKSPRNPCFIEQMIKLRGHKPIWVVDSEEAPFGKSSPCYSPGMALLLSRMGLVRFSVVRALREVVQETRSLPEVIRSRVDWQASKFPGRCSKCDTSMQVGELMTFDPLMPGLKKRICKKNCEARVGS